MDHSFDKDDLKRCSKCGGSFPCPEHTVIVDQKTGTILYPDDKDTDNDVKQKIRDIRDLFSGQG